MFQTFDPYYQWLGIPLHLQPPTHYRLLGLEVFENNPDVIAAAADRQMAHVRLYQLGEYSDLSQKLLNELAAAKVCLLVPERKTAYDAELKKTLEATTNSGSKIGTSSPWAMPVEEELDLAPETPPTASPSTISKPPSSLAKRDTPSSIGARKPGTPSPAPTAPPTSKRESPSSIGSRKAPRDTDELILQPSEAEPRRRGSPSSIGSRKPVHSDVPAAPPVCTTNPNFESPSSIGSRKNDPFLDIPASLPDSLPTIPGKSVEPWSPEPPYMAEYRRRLFENLLKFGLFLFFLVIGLLIFYEVALPWIKSTFAPPQKPPVAPTSTTPKEQIDKDNSRTVTKPQGNSAPSSIADDSHSPPVSTSLSDPTEEEQNTTTAKKNTLSNASRVPFQSFNTRTPSPMPPSEPDQADESDATSSPTDEEAETKEPASDRNASDEKSSKQPHGESFFIGCWHIHEEGRYVSSITLLKNHTARDSRHPSVRGDWEFKYGRAEITWSDGWRVVLRRKGDKVVKVSYSPDDPGELHPANEGTATKDEKKTKD